MDVEALARLPGTRFPGGSYTVDSGDHQRVLGVVGAGARPDGSAHPVYAFIAALRAMGWTVDQFLAACDARADEGPLLAGCRLVFEQPLRVGETYHVTGEITAADRKAGRRAGTFDLVSFELRLAVDGEVAARAVQTWVLPRREP